MPGLLGESSEGLAPVSEGGSRPESFKGSLECLNLLFVFEESQSGAHRSLIKIKTSRLGSIKTSLECVKQIDPTEHNPSR